MNCTSVDHGASRTLSCFSALPPHTIHPSPSSLRWQMSLGYFPWSTFLARWHQAWPSNLPLGRVPSQGRVSSSPSPVPTGGRNRANHNEVRARYIQSIRGGLISAERLRFLPIAGMQSETAINRAWPFPTQSAAISSHSPQTRPCFVLQNNRLSARSVFSFCQRNCALYLVNCVIVIFGCFVGPE